MSIVPGGAFKCKNDEFIGDSLHVWVILSDPTRDAERVLLVNLSSAYQHTDYDTSCVLDVGDHSSIRHRTFVYYGRARVRSVRELSEAELAHTATMSSQVLARMREGAMKSRKIRRNYKQMLVDQGLISASSESSDR